MNFRPTISGSFRIKPTKFKENLEKIEQKYQPTTNNIDIGPWLVGLFVILTFIIIVIKL